MALSLLTLGQLPRGFAEYEWRWKRSRHDRCAPRLPRPTLARRISPRSAHDPARGRTGARRQHPVRPLCPAAGALRRNSRARSAAGTEGVACGRRWRRICHARGETLPAYDVYCPLGSLPLAFKTEPATIPADIPYLRADETHWRNGGRSIEALPGKRVAFAWAGHARHPNDRNRSIALGCSSLCFALDGFSFISVQRDLRGDDAVLLARQTNVTHIGTNLHDMAETAAVLALADLTIAVDTSVVHLAGAMGREAWVMLPFSPDWRWTLTGDHSPWYPRTRLFRQAKPGDWSGVIAAACATRCCASRSAIDFADQAATRIRGDRRRRFRMRLEPIARGALRATDLGIAHLLGDFTAQSARHPCDRASRRC